MRNSLSIAGALTAIIGCLWSVIALLYSTDSETLGSDLTVGIIVAVTGVLIALIAWEKP